MDMSSINLEGSSMCELKWVSNIEENSCTVVSVELHICHQEAAAVWVFGMEVQTSMENSEGQPRIAITMLMDGFWLLYVSM